MLNHRGTTEMMGSDTLLFKKYEVSDSFWKNMLRELCTFISRSKQKGQSHFWNPFATFKIMSTFLHLNGTLHLLVCILPIQFYAQTWTTSERTDDSRQRWSFLWPSDQGMTDKALESEPGACNVAEECQNPPYLLGASISSAIKWADDSFFLGHSCEYSLPLPAHSQ